MSFRKHAVQLPDPRVRHFAGVQQAFHAVLANAERLGGGGKREGGPTASLALKPRRNGVRARRDRVDFGRRSLLRPPDFAQRRPAEQARLRDVCALAWRWTMAALDGIGGASDGRVLRAG